MHAAAVGLDLELGSRVGPADLDEVASEMADRVMVMYAGRVAETAGVRELFARPRHPYTMGLLASLPRMDVDVDELDPIPGNPPNLADPPAGCPFHPRCPIARDRCRTERPPLEPVAEDVGVETRPGRALRIAVAGRRQAEGQDLFRA